LKGNKGKSPLPISARSRTAGAPSKPASPRPTAEEALRIILASLDDMKAEDSVTIDLSGKSSIADFMVVTSGRSNRHVVSIAERVVKDLHQAGIKNVRVEGKQQGDWVLIDAGDVIVHVFRPEVRDFYGLEKMWAGTRGDRRRAS
jgi:ribosome-associated protein